MGASMAKNFAHPESGFIGWLAINMMKRNNSYLERQAALQCQIQPDFIVLEVGFGTGVGLESAYNCVKDGSGIIHGTDTSEKMREIAGENLKEQIAAGKVHIHSYSVDDMQFEDSMFDYVFHCNTFYFWPDMDKAVTELKRVMKPGTKIVTVFHLKRLQKATELGMILGDSDPERYTDALRRCGFTDVSMTDHIDSETNVEFQCIYALSPET